MRRNLTISHRFALWAVMLVALTGCGSRWEDFEMTTGLQPDDLRMGVDFDFPMEKGVEYATAVACSVDLNKPGGNTVALRFTVISPDYVAYQEEISFPVVQESRQTSDMGDALVRFKKRGAMADMQWGWRKGVSCDTLPGEWRVLITAATPEDANRITALGFTFKGEQR
ncbi:MAG: hypothetical protein HUJ91_06915 [Bacteroidales bacterium]|nr:hypothetical protein [Bacteroidales bacterium]